MSSLSLTPPTFLHHRAPTPPRSASVPPGTINFGLCSTRRCVPVALVSSAVSAPVSPHNAASSPLFRLIAPSTVDLPYRGQWLPPLDGATERVLLASDKLTAAELRGARTSTDLVIIGAVDSGCTGSLTPHHRALINVRPCDEKFSSADGTVTSATCIGDMPVTIRDHLGHPHTVVFRNVCGAFRTSTTRCCRSRSSGRSSASTPDSPTAALSTCPTGCASRTSPAVACHLSRWSA